MGRGEFISGTLFSDNLTFLVFNVMVSFLMMCCQIRFLIGKHWECGVGNVRMGGRGQYCGDGSMGTVAWG